MKINAIKPNKDNPRTISPDAMAKLVSSIKDFPKMMELRPIVVDSDMTILGGNMRYAALKELKYKDIPDGWVKVADKLTDDERRRFIIEDNVAFGDWDADALFSEFSVDELLGWGFNEGDIPERFIAPGDGLTDDDAVPDITEKPTVKTGDVYALGEHRLICGDATKQGDIKIMMNGLEADMVFIDPPYNVDYEGYTKDKLTIKSDDVPEDEYRQFLRSSFLGLKRYIKGGASMYVCHASAWQMETESALLHAGFSIRCQIIWAKNTFAWGFGRYKFQHEPIFYVHIKDNSDAWYGDKSQSTLWMEKKPAANKLHPTMKPVEIVLRAINNSSKRGDIVVDTFLGSGTTLIACEKSDRKCYGAEIDPKYCNVIIKRWEDFTGKKAELINGTTKG